MLSVTNLVRQVNELKAHFKYELSAGNQRYNGLAELFSRIYRIDKINFQIRIRATDSLKTVICNHVSSRVLIPYQNLPELLPQSCLILAKLSNADVTTTPYSVKLSSASLRINKDLLCNGEWCLICETVPNDCNFDIKVQVAPLERFSKYPFASLHEDGALTDFELCGSDGSVRLHCAVLAVSIPVLGRMLEGKWRETEKRLLELPHTTKETLSHLKDYIYLGILPETGVDQLLLVASCYMMEELEDKCITKLINSINAENAMELSRFAISNNMTKLYLAFLERVKEGAVDIDKMRELVLSLSIS